MSEAHLFSFHLSRRKGVLREDQPHLLPLMSCSLCCCAGAAISIPRFGNLRGIRILRAARNRSSSRIIHELWGILSARWPAARVIYGVKVVMEERIVSSSSCWGCPVDDGNYREPSFSFSSFSSDLFFSFFFFFSPRILSSRSLPLPAIIGYSDGFNRHWMV